MGEVGIKNLFVDGKTTSNDFWIKYFGMPLQLYKLFKLQLEQDRIIFNFVVDKLPNLFIINVEKTDIVQGATTSSFGQPRRDGVAWFEGLFSI